MPESNTNNFTGTLVKFTLESWPGYFCDFSLRGVREKITINSNCKAFLTTTDSYRSFDASGTWYRGTISRGLVLDIFSQLTDAFSSYQIAEKCCDCGGWVLKIYNSDGKVFTFSGDVFEECFVGAGKISNLLRLAFYDDRLICFDGCIKTYIYLSVLFEGSKKKYYYQTDDENISVGDKVVVQVAEGDKIVEVVEVQKFYEQQVPMPLDKVKFIKAVV